MRLHYLYAFPICRIGLIELDCGDTDEMYLSLQTDASD